MELTREVAVLGIAIGLMLSLVCYLATNLSPGGMISPGWLALVFVEDSKRGLLVIAVAALTYGLAVVLQRVVILYGKRLFAAVVMVGLFVQLTVFLFAREFVTFSDTSADLTNSTLGFVIPGVVAYQFTRQPPVPTLAAVVVVSAVVFGIMYSAIQLGFVSGPP